MGVGKVGVDQMGVGQMVPNRIRYTQAHHETNNNWYCTKETRHWFLQVIRESVDSLCRDGADTQYMQYLSQSCITSPQTRKKLI